ncbi:MAG: Ig-like domain-containing protein [Solirubrobacterales bacterium]
MPAILGPRRLALVVAAAAMFLTMVAAISVGNAAVSGTDVTYTLDGQFDQGTLVNVNHDAPNNNQLQLNTETSTFPFIWIALSARGTIVKIDTVTGAILGEYSSSSDGDNCNNTSRTTVALDGSAWAGNRCQSSAIHVGLEEANQCVDRNGNGTIETSSGYGDVLPWPGGGNAASSDVSNAQDECILHYVGNFAPATDLRHVTADADGNVWFSSYSSGGDRIFRLVDGATGNVIRTEGVGPTFNGCGGYGGVIDGNGVIWSANGGSSGLLRWDPDAPFDASNPQCLNVPVYGLAVDSGDNVWAGELGPQVRKVSPDGNTVAGPFAHGASNAQGLVVGNNDDVWVSSSLFCGGGCTVGHLLNDGTFIGNVSPSGTGSTGVAVDAAGKIWTANINSSDASRIDPNAGPIGADAVTPIGAVDLTVPLPGASPYNYSDMTGNVLLRTTQQGTWTVIQDGGAAGTSWNKVIWNTEPQGRGTQIAVEARASDTEAGLGGQQFSAISNGGAFSLPGRFIQVRITLSPEADGSSPVLSDVRICNPNGCKASAQSASAAKPKASASLRGAKRSCVRRTISARVTGKEIKNVVFSIDGKRRKTDSKSPFSVKASVRKLRSGVHRLTARVRFSAASAAKPTTKRFSFQRCARKAAKPKFTG